MIKYNNSRATKMVKYRNNLDQFRTISNTTCLPCNCDGVSIPINSLGDAFDFYRNTTNKFLNDLIVIAHIKVQHGGTIDNLLHFVADYGYIFFSLIFVMLLIYQSRLWYNFYIGSIWSWKTKGAITVADDGSIIVHTPSGKGKKLLNIIFYIFLIIYSIIVYLVILLGNFITLLITFSTYIFIFCLLIYLFINLVDGIATNLNLNNI